MKTIEQAAQKGHVILYTTLSTDMLSLRDILRSTLSRRDNILVEMVSGFFWCVVGTQYQYVW
jgi:hypothetical protein